MKTTGHLIVNHKGALRITKNLPALEPYEIAIRINLDLPDKLFQRPRLEASISIPHGAVLDLTADEVVEITAEQVAGTLGLDVADVIDGLQVLVDQRDEVQS